MINILVGETVPVDERKTDIGLIIRTDPQFNGDPASSRFIRIKSRFADIPGLNYENEAKNLQSCFNTLIMLSKNLNYIAKHILEEIGVTVRVEQEAGAHYMIIELVVKDPEHWVRLSQIAAGLSDKNVGEKVELLLQTNFNGFFKLGPDGNPTKLLYAANVELQRSTKEVLIESIKSIEKKEGGGLDELISRLIYFLSLKKLRFEADVDFDLIDLLPKEFQPQAMLDIGSFYPNAPTEIPLTTSMKKIVAIFKEKTAADIELKVQIDSFEILLWVKAEQLYTGNIDRFVVL